MAAQLSAVTQISGAIEQMPLIEEIQTDGSWEERAESKAEKKVAQDHPEEKGTGTITSIAA